MTRWDEHPTCEDGAPGKQVWSGTIAVELDPADEAANGATEDSSGVAAVGGGDPIFCLFDVAVSDGVAKLVSGDGQTVQRGRHPDAHEAGAVGLRGIEQ